ncbi:hypothetical protein [Streptomyces gardneri]|uniref:hypothetical protein n=1 Tax=Streptomyces gardneri TaxID=66892 RepID=UPI00340EEED3
MQHVDRVERRQADQYRSRPHQLLVAGPLHLLQPIHLIEQLPRHRRRLAALGRAQSSGVRPNMPSEANPSANASAPTC